MINDADITQNTRINDYITRLWYCYAKEIAGYLCGRPFTCTNEAEDMLQTTFERFIRLLKNSQEQQPEAVITNARAYLYTIAHRVYIESQRKYQKWDRLIISADALVDNEGHSFLESLSDGSCTLEEALLRREQALNLSTQINQLPLMGRKVLYYAYFAGMSLKEISLFLGLPERVVRSYLFSARQHLRKDLQSELNGDEKLSPAKSSKLEQNATGSRIKPLNPNNNQMPVAYELASKIAQLPEPYRSVLTLAMLERRKYTQIAALRGCPLGTIKVQISRGIRLLRSGQLSASLSPQKSIAPRELPHLEALPENHRTILTLREIRGFSYKQIAEHLELPLSRVKKRLYCARVAYHALFNQQSCQPRTLPRRRSIPLDELSRLDHPAYRHFYDALRLAYVEHFSDEEIAAYLHRPVGTVKAHIARGIKLLVLTGSLEKPEESCH